MWQQLFFGALISLVNFGVHAVITGFVIFATGHTARVTGAMGRLARIAALMFVTMTALTVAHVLEISVWSAYYDWVGIHVKNATAFEFAFENYTALGYGDATPPEQWRLTGPITALNGLLLIGWSVAVLFEVMRMAEVKFDRLPAARNKSTQK
jgi:hypothetical protein